MCSEFMFYTHGSLSHPSSLFLLLSATSLGPFSVWHVAVLPLPGLLVNSSDTELSPRTCIASVPIFLVQKNYIFPQLRCSGPLSKHQLLPHLFPSPGGPLESHGAWRPGSWPDSSFPEPRLFSSGLIQPRGLFPSRLLLLE